MTTGRIFAVVGPSGAGKDTVMAALRERRTDLYLVRRVITRPQNAGGEPFEGVSEAQFAARAAAGEFALEWRAHGLRYGIPVMTFEAMEQGRDVLFNGSRAMLVDAAKVFPGLQVLHVTARPEVLAARLAMRGREDETDIAKRLERASLPLPSGPSVREIDNSGNLDEAVAACLVAIDHTRTGNVKWETQ